MEDKYVGININHITENYYERMQRLTLFEPLYKLEKKSAKDNNNHPIDYLGLGLLALLFFFENMIIRNKKVGVKELAVFYQELTKDVLELDPEEYEKLARTIIEVFRPPTGRRNEKTFFNWHTKMEESIQYSVLKAHKSDLSTNTQYYVLDEQGLELIFATKEYFSEFQLSINQLILRKQLEKGEFSAALRQVEEMRLDVHTLNERISKVGSEVHRNIISEETLARYTTIIEDINFRLAREGEEFNELQTFVRETKEKLSFNIVSEKDRKAYESIIEVDKELGEVHAEHRELLKRSLILKTSALTAAEEALYFTSVTIFNFENEIAKRLFASPLPVITTSTLVKPFLQLEGFEAWSPLAVFAPQRLTTDVKQEKLDEFPELDEARNLQSNMKELQGNFQTVITVIQQVLGEGNEITLAETIEYIKERDQSYLLNAKYFYLFWIMLHKKSPINVNDFDEYRHKSAFAKAITQLSHQNRIRVVETGEVLTVNKKFSISNMKLALEEL